MQERDSHNILDLLRNIDAVNEFKSKNLAKRAMKIAESLKYFEIGKKTHEETFRHTLKDDSMLVYMEEVFKSL